MSESPVAIAAGESDNFYSGRVGWLWRYENAEGTPVEASGFAQESFPTQADAETWIGEIWRELVEAGVAQVSLLEDGREVYGPMALTE